MKFFRRSICFNWVSFQSCSRSYFRFSDALATLFWSVYGLLPYESLDIVVGETESNSTESETGENEVKIIALLVFWNYILIPSNCTFGINVVTNISRT